MELLNVGGNANNGAQCGVSYSNSNNGFEHVNPNLGARLKFYFDGEGESPTERYYVPLRIRPPRDGGEMTRAHD